MKDIRIILFVSLVLAVHLRDVESINRMSLEQIRKALMVVRRLCIEDEGVDPKLIDDANEGKFVPDPKLKCYYKCMMQLTKYMTKDNKIDEKFVLKSTKESLLEELVQPVLKSFQHCMPLTRKNLEGCDLAYELAKCYYEFDPALSFFP